MNQYQQQYAAKKRTPMEIAETFRSGWLCTTGSVLSEPPSITSAVGAYVKRAGLIGLVHSQTLSCRKGPYFDPELAGRYSAVSWFTGAAARESVLSGCTDSMPAYYRDMPALWREYFVPDVFYAAVSPMDRHGWFSFGCTGGEIMAQVEKARRIYLEVNPNVPRTFGPFAIHISQVDLLCESDEPLTELPAVPIDETSTAIGALIAQEIGDGMTIQLGIGAIPGAVGHALKQKRDLGIHSEMFTESMIDLIECGAVNNLKKPIHKGKSVASFTAGGQRIYDFVGDNPGVEFHPVDYVNNPEVIARHARFVSVNSALEVDFYGQVCAESQGWRPYSGTGGQTDFVRGAVQSPGGKSFIAFKSTAKNGTVSRIRPSLSEGAVVSTSKNDVDYVVTEFGIAKLRGKTLSQRTKELIFIAHFNFRDELTYEAKKRNLII